MRDLCRRDAGLTLGELMIVLALISIVAAVAAPRLLAARLDANETGAIHTLREVAAAQAQFRAAAACDLDHDRRGEFGWFKELSAVGGVRASADGAELAGPLERPLMPSAFRLLDEKGQVLRSGYLFRMFLPGAGGVGVGEPQLAALSTPVDVDLAETAWGCYAWPANAPISGTRAFFVGADGIVVETDGAQGGTRGPFDASSCGSALLDDTGSRSSLVGPTAVDARGRDGNLWRRTK